METLSDESARRGTCKESIVPLLCSGRSGWFSTGRLRVDFVGWRRNREEALYFRRTAMQTPWLRTVLGSWLVGLLVIGAAGSARSAGPVEIRISSFTVAPAHTPLAVVHVRNISAVPYHGRLCVKGPEGWLIVPPDLEISVPAGGAARAAFTVQRGTNLEANSYPIEVSAASARAMVTRRQNVVCASAPFYKPKIDGKADDWKDAIPVTFVTAGKKTVIGTYWNRRRFAILVAVEEDKLVPWLKDDPQQPCDAIQLAFSPHETPTPTSPGEAAGRYEFLVVATGGPQDGRWKARCFQLAELATKLGQTQKPRDLSGLELAGAEAAVSRSGAVTYYECAIPFKALPEIQPGEGREFCLSLLVHDPDGTGLRDWGQAAGLWPSQRNRLAWSLWPGARFGNVPPLDNKTPWGLCSSKY